MLNGPATSAGPEPRTPAFERKGGRGFFISARQRHLFGPNGYREQRLIYFPENHQVKYLLEFR